MCPAGGLALKWHLRRTGVPTNVTGEQKLTKVVIWCAWHGWCNPVFLIHMSEQHKLASWSFSSPSRLACQVSRDLWPSYQRAGSALLRVTKLFLVLLYSPLSLQAETSPQATCRAYVNQSFTGHPIVAKLKGFEIHYARVDFSDGKLQIRGKDLNARSDTDSDDTLFIYKDGTAAGGLHLGLAVANPFDPGRPVLAKLPKKAHEEGTIHCHSMRNLMESHRSKNLNFWALNTSIRATIASDTGEPKYPGLHGEALIRAEQSAHVRAGLMDYPFDRVLRSYKGLLDRARRSIEQESKNASRHPLFEFTSIRQVLIESGLARYYRDDNSLKGFFVDGHTNCQGQTALFFALVRDLGLKAPEPYVFGSQFFTDHVRPVLLNTKTRSVLDLVYATGEAFDPKAPILQGGGLNLLALANLDVRGAKLYFDRYNQIQLDSSPLSDEFSRSGIRQTQIWRSPLSQFIESNFSESPSLFGFASEQGKPILQIYRHDLVKAKIAFSNSEAPESIQLELSGSLDSPIPRTRSPLDPQALGSIQNQSQNFCRNTLRPYPMQLGHHGADLRRRIESGQPISRDELNHLNFRCPGSYFEFYEGSLIALLGDRTLGIPFALAPELEALPDNYFTRVDFLRRKFLEELYSKMDDLEATLRTSKTQDLPRVISDHRYILTLVADDRDALATYYWHQKELPCHLNLSRRLDLGGCALNAWPPSVFEPAVLDWAERWRAVNTGILRRAMTEPIPFLQGMGSLSFKETTSLALFFNTGQMAIHTVDESQERLEQFSDLGNAFNRMFFKDILHSKFLTTDPPSDELLEVLRDQAEGKSSASSGHETELPRMNLAPATQRHVEQACASGQIELVSMGSFAFQCPGSRNSDSAPPFEVVPPQALAFVRNPLGHTYSLWNLNTILRFTMGLGSTYFETLTRPEVDLEIQMEMFRDILQRQRLLMGEGLRFDKNSCLPGWVSTCDLRSASHEYLFTRLDAADQQLFSVLHQQNELIWNTLSSFRGRDAVTYLLALLPALDGSLEANPLNLWDALRNWRETPGDREGNWSITRDPIQSEGGSLSITTHVLISTDHNDIIVY